MLKDAVELAKRGFRVFPCIRGDKAPAVKGWQEKATADLLDVCELWGERAYNVGIATAGFVVVDVDVEKGGFEHYQTLGEFPPTFTVRTGRGGLHMYYRAPEGKRFANSASKIAPGVDIRADGGLAIGPGSTFKGGHYSIERDLPVAALPDWLAAKVNEARVKSTDAGKVLGELDTDAAIAKCREKLANAPEVYEGARDNTAFAFACSLYDYGITRETCLELLHEYNELKVIPPLDEDALERISHSARTSRGAVIGRDNPTAGLNEIVHPSPAALAAVNPFIASIKRYNRTEAEDALIPPRPWLIPRRLLRGKMTVFVAPGSTGKSLFTLQMALALAMGPQTEPFSGFEVREATKVLVINAEDGTEEMEMRLGAACRAFGVDRETIRDKVLLQSSQDKGSPEFVVARKSGRHGTISETAEVGALIEFCKAENIGAVVVDPFVESHEANENDNGEISRVMKIYRRIATEANVALMLVHHTKKPSAASAESFAGSADAGRGASAILNAARVGLTFFNMTEKDGLKFGIPAHLRHQYVRLDDSKPNLAPGSPFAQWFRKHSVDLPNGEQLGVLRPVNLSNVDAAEAGEILRIIAARVSDGERILVSDAERFVAEHDDFATQSRTWIRTHIIEALKSPSPVADGKVFTWHPIGKQGGTITVSYHNSIR